MHDLDYEPGPEVFETSDTESVDVPPPPEPRTAQKSEDALLELSTEGFDATSTRARLEEFALLDLAANFLGSGTKALGASGLRVFRWAETREQKLARLQQELELLEAEDRAEAAKIDLFVRSLKNMTQSEGKDGYYYQKMSEALQLLDERRQTLQRRLDGEQGGVQSETDNTQSDGTKASSPGPQEHETNSAASFRHCSTLLALETRLARIEAAVGSASADPTRQQNLRVQLNDLRRRVSFLDTPQGLEPVLEAVARLNSNYEALLANRRRVALHNTDTPQEAERPPPTPFAAKVDRLYAKLPEIETANALLPSLVSRLRSLHEVHASVATAAEVAQTVDQTLDTLLRDLSEWASILADANSVVNESEARFAANAAVVDQKILCLERKLNANSDAL